MTAGKPPGPLDHEQWADEVWHHGGRGMGGGGRPPQRGESNYRAAMEAGSVVIVTLAVLILAELRRIRRRLPT